MSNEHFLISSYFSIGIFILVIAVVVYLSLERPLAEITQTFRNIHLGVIVKKSFLYGLVLAAMAGFLLVSYHSCESNYAKIVANRSYLVEKNQEQISTACLFLMIALLVWGIVVLIGLKTQRGDPPPRQGG